MRRWSLCAIVAGLALAGAGSALADTVLLATSPADGATLTRAPRVVRAIHASTLGEVAEAQAVVEGRDVLAGPPRLDPADARRALIPLRDAGPGLYEVTWVVRAADGHPLAGEMSFRVRAPAFSGQMRQLALVLMRVARTIASSAADLAGGA